MSSYLCACTLLLAPFTSFSQTETPNPGPRTANEPKVLFTEGVTALQNLEFKEAAKSFQRLIDRYPLDLNFIDSHFKLGEAYLKSGEAIRAIKPLKEYIENHAKDDLGNTARLSLTEAYLLSGKFSEARATAEEVMKKTESQVLEQKALLLKSLVLIRQKKLDQAKAALDSVNESADETLKNKVNFLLKSNQCAAIPDPKKPQSKDESLWLAHLQTLKNCYKESLVQDFKDLQKNEIAEWCTRLKQSETHLKKVIKDSSFIPKVTETFKDIKNAALEKTKELVKCYE